MINILQFIKLAESFDCWSVCGIDIDIEGAVIAERLLISDIGLCWCFKGLGISMLFHCFLDIEANGLFQSAS
ncbi:hypothetical protein [Shewanella surugensis]|uniref:Uncharacterized protein n=1 Tax=Shewanella surugensis TaxID=212020 RepID=A0ABT0LFJ0_9GAMM|nr:hypothetical protein [Shewanella surugensis]MCL1126240.1 hypothetical protein [Shewanella surugensis]